MSKLKPVKVNNGVGILRREIRRFMHSVPITKTSVTAFLSMLRALHPDLEWQCLRGSCFRLYLLLKEVWPNAEPWCNIDHVITEIDGLFYDIRGEVSADGYFKMKDDALLFNRAYHWGTPIQDRMSQERSHTSEALPPHERKLRRAPNVD